MAPSKLFVLLALFVALISVHNIRADDVSVDGFDSDSSAFEIELERLKSKIQTLG